MSAFQDLPALYTGLNFDSWPSVVIRRVVLDPFNLSQVMSPDSQTALSRGSPLIASF